MRAGGGRAKASGRLRSEHKFPLRCGEAGLFWARRVSGTGAYVPGRPPFGSSPRLRGQATAVAVACSTSSVNFTPEERAQAIVGELTDRGLKYELAKRIARQIREATREELSALRPYLAHVECLPALGCTCGLDTLLSNRAGAAPRSGREKARARVPRGSA